MKTALASQAASSSSTSTAIKFKPAKLKNEARAKTASLVDATRTIGDILRDGSELTPVDPPLSARDISQLLASAKGHVQMALAYEGLDGDDIFDMPLEALEECVRAAKSHKPLRLSPQQVDLCASFFALALYKQTTEWAEALYTNACNRAHNYNCQMSPSPLGA